MIKKNIKLVENLKSSLELIEKELDSLEENDTYESDEYSFQFYYALSDTQNTIEKLLDGIENDFYL